MFGRFEIRIPKRPRSTLSWPGFISRTTARFAVKKNAITVWKLLQALSDTDATDVKTLEFFDIVLQADSRGQSRNLLLVDPNVARRSRTAISALRALES